MFPLIMWALVMLSFVQISNILYFFFYTRFGMHCSLCLCLLFPLSPIFLFPWPPVHTFHLPSTCHSATLTSPSLPTLLSVCSAPHFFLIWVQTYTGVVIEWISSSLIIISSPKVAIIDFLVTALSLVPFLGSSTQERFKYLWNAKG